MPASPKHASPLSSADAAFRMLTRGPDPLSLDGTAISGTLPQRLTPLDELKRILLRASTDGGTRDAAWSALVTRARSDGPGWVVGTVGVAMPGLRRVAGQLARGFDLDTAADIDAEILTGFLAAVRSLDLSRRAIALRLRWAAYRAGAAYRAKVANHPVPTEEPGPAAVPPRSSGHPDLLLADEALRPHWHRPDCRRRPDLRESMEGESGMPRSKSAITVEKMAFATWSRSGGWSVRIRLDNAGGYARAANRLVCVTLTGEEMARVLEGITLTDCPNEIWAAIVRVRGFLART